MNEKDLKSTPPLELRFSTTLSKVVVFGGSGFIGSHVADHLSKAGYKVFIYDIRKSSYLQDEQEMIVGDILDQKNVDKAVQGAKAVYNYAALADLDKVINQPVETINVNLLGTVKILDALSYLDFLHLMRDSKVIFTDSGGIQEESTILKIPCYTLRNNTERPITIQKGTNHLVGNKQSNILDAFTKYKFKVNDNYKTPHGWDGLAASRIINTLKQII